VLAAISGALACVSVLLSSVGVTETIPMKNSSAIDWGSYKSFKDLKSLKAIPAWSSENRSYPAIRTTENALEAIVHV
jgi:hypothetical protein